MGHRAAIGLVVGFAFGCAGPATLDVGGAAVPASDREASLAPQAAFEVVYADAVPAPARAAFDYAAANWSRILLTSVKIRVHVGWISGNGPTGFAYPNQVREPQGAPRTGVYYPSALADALAGRDLQPGAIDIDVFFKEGDHWYFGTDGAVGKAQTDFVTSAMHEIAHGLGITTSAFVPWEGEQVASFGQPNEYLDFFTWSFPLPELDGTPTVYDSMIVDPQGRRLVDASVYPNPSPRLYEALKGPIAFDGPKVRAANGGAVLPVDSGSVSHISRSVLIETDPDWQMAPDTGRGVAQHQPGPKTRAILEDLGWTLRPPGGTPVSAAPDPG